MFEKFTERGRKVIIYARKKPKNVRMITSGQNIFSSPFSGKKKGSALQ